MTSGAPSSGTAVVALFALALFTPGCTETGREAYEKASKVDLGATEADVIQSAGPPTSRVAPLGQKCQKSGGTHELVYVVSTSLAGWRRTPLVAIAFCIDGSSKVVDQSFIVY
jgi:hypothetical protein